MKGDRLPDDVESTDYIMGYDYKYIMGNIIGSLSLNPEKFTLSIFSNGRVQGRFKMCNSSGYFKKKFNLIFVFYGNQVNKKSNQISQSVSVNDYSNNLYRGGNQFRFHTDYKINDEDNRSNSKLICLVSTGEFCLFENSVDLFKYNFNILAKNALKVRRFEVKINSTSYIDSKYKYVALVPIIFAAIMKR